jgi:uncharacterized protein (DUF1499 family)
MRLISGPGLAVASVVLLLAGPLGTRVGIWPFLVGFLLLGVSLLLAVAAVVASVVAAMRGGPWGTTAAGIVVGLAVIAVPALTVLSARGAPPINDITTDTDDPPQFVAAVPLRAGADPANPPEYGGSAFAEQQRRAFPDLAPVRLQMPAGKAFERALAVARDQGWNVVASDAGAGRIEANDTTFWFGFTDDIVIRVREGEGGARVDVRSKSRVGRGDLGANARRIRRYLDALRASDAA